MAMVPALLFPLEQVVWASGYGIESRVSAGGIKRVYTDLIAQKKQIISPHNTWQAWHLPRQRLSVSPRTHLPILANGQAALPSNAGNFHGGWNASVNPRTGSASFSMTVDSFLYAAGQGRKSLSLSYSGTASEGGPDPFGLGPQWSWNVGTEHPSTTEIQGHQTTDLTTGDGHSFTMENVRNRMGQKIWRPLRHKLDDVLITGRPGDWTISMATGIREHLKNGYEDWEESRDGKRVWFYYSSEEAGDATRHLTYLCAHPLTPAEVRGANNACPNAGIWLTYQAGTITVHGRQTIALKNGSSGGVHHISEIVLPSLSSEGISNGMQPSRLKFDYDLPGNRPWLLSSVRYPDQRVSLFQYNEESKSSDAPHGLATGLNHSYLPVVTEQIMQSGKAAIPDRHIRYYYGDGKRSQHNYTGYQGSSIMIPGRDNLLDRTDDYTYRVSQDDGQTRTTTTYNKYHLPLTVLQSSDASGALIGQSEKTYAPWKHTTFDQLPPNYSFPAGETKTLYAVADRNAGEIAPVKVMEQSRYDRAGRPVWKRNAFGDETFTQYCPPQGDEHCPKMEADWPREVLPEKVLHVPAPKQPDSGKSYRILATMGEDQAAPVETTYDYKAFAAAPAPGSGNVQVLKSGVSAPESGHFWQMVAKNVGTVAPSAVTGLKPGDTLPDTAPADLASRTLYEYDAEPQSTGYGELKRMTLIRNPSPAPRIHGHLLNLARAMVKAQPQQRLTIDVEHETDLKNGVRTTRMVVDKADSAGSLPTGFTELAQSDGISLGTTVNSIQSGVKLATDDTLRQIHTQWSYDRWNRPVREVITPTAGARPHTRLWHYILTPKERAVVETDTFGNQKKTIFGPGDETLSTWHRYKNQAGAAMEGDSNWIPDTATTYTVQDKPMKKTIWMAANPEKGKPGPAVALNTFYGYDSLNRPVWTRSPDGEIDITVHDDPAQRVIRYHVYTGVEGKSEHLGPVLKVVDTNLLNKPVAMYDIALNPAVKKHGKALYSADLQSRLQQVRDAMLPAASLRVMNSYGVLPLTGNPGLLEFVRSVIAKGAWLTRTTTEYNGSGQRIRQTLGNGAVTRWQWQKGNMTGMTAPDGRVIHDEFNIRGQKVYRCVQPAGSEVCHPLGSRGYDGEGNLLWQADEAGNTYHYAYDADGRKIRTVTPPTKEAPKGHVITYQYNSIGMVGESIDGEPVVSYRYDPATWQLTDREDRISHIHYSYDTENGRLVGREYRAPSTLKPLPGIYYPEGIEHIDFDRYGRALRYTDLHGNVFTPTLDRIGREIKNEVLFHGQKTPKTLVHTMYDDYGNPASVTNGAGVTKTFTYDDTGHVARTLETLNGKPLQRLDYTYDPDTGNIMSFTRSEGKLSATQQYRYDPVGNLVSMTCSRTGSPGVPDELCPREMSFEGSGFSTPPVIVSQSYHFDAWNNISRVEEKVVALSGKDGKAGKAATKTVTYTYAGERKEAKNPQGYDPHRMIAFDESWSGQKYSAAPHAITYDELGRIVRDASGNALHYNALGYQDRFTNAKTGEVTHYSYDSMGHQVAEQPFDSHGKSLQHPLYMIYTGNRVSAQMQEGADGKTHYSEELGAVARSEDGVITRWYLYDYKGDVLATLNGRGEMDSDMVYSPYGMRYDRLSTESQGLPSALEIHGQRAWWQSHEPGFGGEMTDPATGYQFLGGGYRAYNPVYRHFMSRDSYSPFRQIDGYGFVSNNPIMNTDPTGHMPKWAGYLIGSLGIAMAIGMSLILPGAAFAPAIALGAGSDAFIDTSITGMLLGVTSIATGISGITDGSLQIANTAHPHCTGLAMFTQLFGIFNGLLVASVGSITSVTGIADMITGVARTVGAFVTVSGLTSAVSGLTGGAASGMAAALTGNQDLASKHFMEGMKGLNIVTSVLMGISIAASVGGLIATARMMREGIFQLYQRERVDRQGLISQKSFNDRVAREEPGSSQKIFNKTLERERGQALEMEEYSRIESADKISAKANSGLKTRLMNSDETTNLRLIRNGRGEVYVSEFTVAGKQLAHINMGEDDLDNEVMRVLAKMPGFTKPPNGQVVAYDIVDEEEFNSLITSIQSKQAFRVNID